MNIRNNLNASVPFSSLKQGDLFWSYGDKQGLFIKLRGDYTPVMQYAFNSYKVGTEKGGHGFHDTDMVCPVNEVTVS